MRGHWFIFFNVEMSEHSIMNVIFVLGSLAELLCKFQMRFISLNFSCSQKPVTFGEHREMYHHGDWRRKPGSNWLTSDASFFGN